jgi:hypothetical protein
MSDSREFVAWQLTETIRNRGLMREYVDAELEAERKERHLRWLGVAVKPGALRPLRPVLVPIPLSPPAATLLRSFESASTQVPPTEGSWRFSRRLSRG